MNSNAWIMATASGKRSSNWFVRNGDFSACRRLLTRDSLVDCQQHLITATLGGLQQFAVLLALETCPFHSVSFVAWKTMPEIHW